MGAWVLERVPVHPCAHGFRTTRWPVAELHSVRDLHSGAGRRRSLALQLLRKGTVGSHPRRSARRPPDRDPPRPRGLLHCRRWGRVYGIFPPVRLPRAFRVKPRGRPRCGGRVSGNGRRGWASTGSPTSSDGSTNSSRPRSTTPPATAGRREPQPPPPVPGTPAGPNCMGRSGQPGPGGAPPGRVCPDRLGRRRVAG